MSKKYQSFKDLPPEVAERLRMLIVAGQKSAFPQMREDASIDERMLAYNEAMKNPEYTEKQLVDLVEAFTLVNNAVERGLPNQLYDMFARALDPVLVEIAYKKHLIWYGHEGDGTQAKCEAKQFSDEVKKEIDKRAYWDEEQFQEEHQLNKKNIKTY